MEGFYEVMLNNAVAGKVQIDREGLYYKIQCRCVVPGDVVYRLQAIWDQGGENIGVVVPDGDGFVLNRRIPVKYLPDDAVFQLSASVDERKGKFVPISPEEPFSYIDQLENAFLEIQDGKIGVRLEKDSGAD